MVDTLIRRPGTVVRPLGRDDFDEAVAIDAGILGRRRRAYFERRLRAALAAPRDHVQFAAVQDGILAGYVLGRRMHGEFGRTEPGLRLETLGVRPEWQGHGTGTRLFSALERWALEHDVRQIRTSASWRDHALVGFLDHAGFDLGDRIIDCELRLDRLPRLEKREPAEAAGAGREIDYGAPPLADFTTLARDRVELCSLAPGDLAGIQAIDQGITGRNRTEYLSRLAAEAIAESAVRVSLVARHKGVLVGFLMARTDFGDFGRAEPIAVIDTIGVHRWFAGSGIGNALLSQLFLNLHALGVQRVETVVAPENLGLLAFFRKAGFAPSDRLAFVRQLSRESRH
jgi:ribosomal protein S18 acetylase RimI-like enzyme